MSPASFFFIMSSSSSDDGIARSCSSVVAESTVLANASSFSAVSANGLNETPCFDTAPAALPDHLFEQSWPEATPSARTPKTIPRSLRTASHSPDRANAAMLSFTHCSADI